MSSFDTDRGIMILDPEQWSVLKRMTSGPLLERANYAEGALAGLEDLGIIDPYGPTPVAHEVLKGFIEADSTYSVRRLDPYDPMPVRDISFWLGSPRCTVERHDRDGVHVYACDDVDVPHIALNDDYLHPRSLISDDLHEVYDTLASAARLGDIDAAVRVMRTIGSEGPSESTFVRDAETSHWTMVVHVRQDRGQDGFTTTESLVTLGVTTMLYMIEEDDSPVGNLDRPATGIPLKPILSTDVWAAIVPMMWATS